MVAVRAGRLPWAGAVDEVATTRGAAWGGGPPPAAARFGAFGAGIKVPLLSMARLGLAAAVGGPPIPEGVGCGTRAAEVDVAPAAAPGLALAGLATDDR